MKKLLALVMTATMVAGLAVGCGGGSETKPAGSEKPAASAEESKEPAGSEGAQAEADIPDLTPPEDPMAAVPQSEILAKVPKTKPHGTLTIGDITEPDEYILGGWTNPNSNNNLRSMINGYGTFELDKNNEVVRNNVVLKDFKRTANADGSVTFEETINDNLKFSDGTPITAEHFVANALIGSAQVMEKIGGSATAGDNWVGYKEFYEGDGTTPFKGVRLLDKYKFSLTMDKSQLPNYYETILGAALSPFPFEAVKGLDLKVVDTPEGAKFEKPLTEEAANKAFLDPTTGFAFTQPVSSGPFKFVKFDKENKALIAEANPEFLGTWDGWKPQIEKVIIKYSQSKTIVDELANGTIDIMSPTGGKDSIDAGKAKVEASNGKLGYLTYDRNGFGNITFSCDVGAAHYAEVRRAVAYSLDRRDFLAKYTGGYGSLVNSQYGLAQPEYKANKAAIEKEMNPYNFSLEKAKEELEKGGWTLDKDGNPYKEGVRYKKTEDGKLLACELNWAKTETPVTELLIAVLPGNLEKVGIKLNIEPIDFPKMLKAMYAPLKSPEREKYNMYVLATGFGSVNPYWYYTSPDPAYLQYNTEQLIDQDLIDISLKMKNVKPGDKKDWYKLWLQYELRLNTLMSKIPLYSDLYHQFYNVQKVKHLITSSLIDYGTAVTYAEVAE